MSSQLYYALCDIDLSLDSIYETVRDLELVVKQLDKLNEFSKDNLLDEAAIIQTNLNAVKVCLNLRIQGARYHLVTAFDSTVCKE